MTVLYQLEEIHLLKCSLIPPEVFAFALPQEDCEEWTRLLRDYTEDGKTPDDDWQPASTCRFEVSIENCPIRLLIELPRGYPEREYPIIFVKGDSIQRSEQQKWQEVVNQEQSRVKQEGTDFVVQNLLCTHLVPLLHEWSRDLRGTQQSISTSGVASRQHGGPETYHVLFTSHHLVSPTKRRNLQKWSTELSLRGFTKVGYPGTIYAEGEQDNIAEFVARVKAMQWLALKVRFEEKLDMKQYAELDMGSGETERPKWIELEKVGEVVEIMRRSGREVFVTDMGLGTSSASNS